MSSQKAHAVFKSLQNTASKFLSPSLRAFFMNKSASDYDSFSRGYGKDKSIAEKYIKEQKDLGESLERVVGIYNTYRDSSSTL